MRTIRLAWLGLGALLVAACGSSHSPADGGGRDGAAPDARVAADGGETCGPDVRRGRGLLQRELWDLHGPRRELHRSGLRGRWGDVRDGDVRRDRALLRGL